MKEITSRRINDFLFYVLIVANIPYESGPLALIIPAPAKPYILAFAFVAKFVVAEIKNRQAVQPKPAPEIPAP